MSFSEYGIITAAAPYPYTMMPTFLNDDNLGSIILASSKGQVSIVDLDATSEEEILRIINVFKTNPPSSAFHYSQRNRGGFLFVGGEMSDTLVYWVHTLISKN